MLLAGAAGLAVPAVAFLLRGADKPESWIVTAGSLAVITAVFSAWSSRRVAELQEDALRPNPYPTFDFHSRHGLVQLRVKNTGATAAHDLSLEWDQELTNSNGVKIGFFAKDGRAGVTVLMPSDSISQIIDVPHAFLPRHPDGEYTGRLTFKDPSGRSYNRPFRLDARPYEWSPVDDAEANLTHRELQKVPEQLEKIARAIEKATKRPDVPPLPRMPKP